MDLTNRAITNNYCNNTFRLEIALAIPKRKIYFNNSSFNWMKEGTSNSVVLTKIE